MKFPSSRKAGSIPALTTTRNAVIAPTETTSSQPASQKSLCSGSVVIYANMIEARPLFSCAKRRDSGHTLELRTSSDDDLLLGKPPTMLGLRILKSEHTPRGVLPKTPVVLGKALKYRLVLIFWLRPNFTWYTI